MPPREGRSGFTPTHQQGMWFWGCLVATALCSQLAALKAESPQCISLGLWGRRRGGTGDWAPSFGAGALSSFRAENAENPPRTPGLVGAGLLPGGFPVRWRHAGEEDTRIPKPPSCQATQSPGGGQLTLTTGAPTSGALTTVTPTTGTPTSGSPTSGTPISATPTSATPTSGTRPQRPRPQGP